MQPFKTEQSLFYSQPVHALHSQIIISPVCLEDKPQPGHTPVFEFVDPDVQVRVSVVELKLPRRRGSDAPHLVRLLPDGGGQPADPGASTAGPLRPPPSLPGGLPQRRPVSHDASLHVLPPSVARHQPGADNQGEFSSRDSRLSLSQRLTLPVSVWSECQQRRGHVGVQVPGGFRQAGEASE